ncbi:MAG: hypothetical protein FWC56_03150, partial [Phycisphaerae bacterium]|nr:hypothetical protein [Phycisphaerae bacterium]
MKVPGITKYVCCIYSLLSLLGSTELHAEILSREAAVSSHVTQLFHDGSVATDQASKQWDNSTPLPLVVRSHLEQYDPSLFSFTSGTSIAQFSDSQTSSSDDPKEFSVGGTLFSSGFSATFDASGKTSETRTICYTSSDIGQPDGTSLRVTSHFFLNGYLIIWGNLGVVPGKSSAAISIRVSQNRSGAASPMVLMNTQLELTHDENGQLTLTAQGGLSTSNLVLDDHLGLLASLGTTYFATIPELTIPYQYNANVGEEFTLTAEVECHLVNRPFTGVGVALGQTLDEFVSAIAAAIGQSIPTTTKAILQTSAAKLPVESLPVEKDTNIEVDKGVNCLFGAPLTCGPVGVEMLLLCGSLPVMLAIRPVLR